MVKPVHSKAEERLKNLWVKESIHRALKSLSARTGKTISQLAEEYLEPHVANEMRLLSRNGGKA